MYSDKNESKNNPRNFLNLQGDETITGQDGRKKFFFILIILGCFSLIALYGAIYLNASIQSLFQNAINEGLVWEGTRQNLTRLSVLAGRVNAPINNVFVSRQIDRERQEMRQEYLAFLEVLNQLNSQFKNRNDTTGEQILMYLDDVNANLYAMMSEAEFVFTYLQANQFDFAVERMAEADELFRDAAGYIGNADQVVQRASLERLSIEGEEVKRFYKLGQIVISILTVCFVIFVILGVRMVKTLNRNQLALAYSRTLLSKTLNSVADSVIGCRPDGQITEWNYQAERLFGEDLGGRINIDQLVPGLSKKIYQNNHGEFEKFVLQHEKAVSLALSDDLNMITEGDIDVDINIARISGLEDQSLKITAFVLTIKDMREIRKSAAIIAKSQAKLRLQLHRNDLIRRQLASQAKVLEQEKLKAEASTAAKSRFLAVMSHELRTPMNAIMGFSKIMQRSELKHSQKEVLKRIVDASNHLLGIINDILDMSKIESGGLNLEARPTMFVDELKNIVQSFGDAKKKKNLRFFAYIDPHLPHQLILDSTRLRQILTNLLGNAFQFTEQGCVWLRVYQLDSESNKNVKRYKTDEMIQSIRFEVHDTGIGLSPDQIKRVFDPFTQADDSITRKYGGTGLGLTITKQLIQRFGGDIELKSEVGKGSQFSFTLDLKVLEDPDDVAPKPIVVPERPIAVIGHDVRFLDWIDYCFNQSFNGRPVSYEVLNKIDEQFFNWWTRHHNQAQTEHEKPLIICDGYLSEHDFQQMITSFKQQNHLLSSCFYLVNVGAESRVEAEQVYGRSIYMPVFPSDLLHLLAFGHSAQKYLENQHFDESHKDIEIPSLNGRQVLIVDDVLSNRQYIHELLKSTGCGITLVESGRKAIEMCQIRLFDLVFMDIHMPDMNGYDTTKEIKKIRYARKTHIVGLTSDAVDDVLIQCLESGMTSCLAKPLSPPDFYSTIVFLLQKKNIEKKYVNHKILDNIHFDNINIDIEGALDRINHKNELYLRLITAFLNRVDDLDARLHALLDASISSETSQYLESIRGTALSVGAIELSEMISNFETALHQDSDPRIAYDLCLDAWSKTKNAMNLVQKKLAN